MNSGPLPWWKGSVEGREILQWCRREYNLYEKWRLYFRDSRRKIIIMRCQNSKHERKSQAKKRANIRSGCTSVNAPQIIRYHFEYVSGIYTTAFTLVKIVPRYLRLRSTKSSILDDFTGAAAQFLWRHRKPANDWCVKLRAARPPPRRRSYDWSQFGVGWIGLIHWNKTVLPLCVICVWTRLIII